MINSMLKTPERAERMSFSDPYYDGGIVADTGLISRSTSRRISRGK